MPSRLFWLPFAAAALPFMLAAITPGMAATDPLAGHRWKDRVLLVVAESAEDPQLRQQQDIFRRMGGEARERDLKLVVTIGSSAESEAIRQRFGLRAGFHALLIGKDGGAKLKAETPLGPEALLPLIDAMPMRQEEMRRGS